MKSFDYRRPLKKEDATVLGSSHDARFLAGGTTLLDLMKCGAERPDTLVDIGRLGLPNTVERSGRVVSIGALATMSHVASSDITRAYFPSLMQSLLQAASPQIRNMATIGGNLMQRTRCAYFRDPSFEACNKRNPGSGCAAFGGKTESHALLGTSMSCIAAYPGDLAVALVALDATVHVGLAPERSIPISEFFPLPGDTPHREHPVVPGELIMSVTLTPTPTAARSTYLKLRQRHSYEFATVSVAAGLELAADGRTIRDVRIALGGVATVPWRAYAVEQALVGGPFDEAAIETASGQAVEGACATADNAYKLALIPRAVTRALLSLQTGQP